VLDFGAGTGVLAIAAALHGARVEAVEIDARALAAAAENVRLNRVPELVELRRHLAEPPRQHDLVGANIVSPVLLEHAEALCARQAPSGRLVLSGFLGPQVPEILARYGPLLAPMRSQVYERGEWRAVMFG
jgi:ribosomal protein L11 methyltransferase